MNMNIPGEVAALIAHAQAVTDPGARRKLIDEPLEFIKEAVKDAITDACWGQNERERWRQVHETEDLKKDPATGVYIFDESNYVRDSDFWVGVSATGDSRGEAARDQEFDITITHDPTGTRSRALVLMETLLGD